MKMFMKLMKKKLKFRSKFRQQILFAVIKASLFKYHI